MSVRIITGDCRDVLATLDAESVHCCVTSPPYFGLRDYGVGGQMGLESSPDEFLAGMVQVFREVRRVLRNDGTLWLNIGDSYAGSWGAQGRSGGNGDGKHAYNKSISKTQIANAPAKTHHTGRIAAGNGIKPKELYGIPWMLAFALRADGWYLRQDIIWSKPNPMPESVRDRCTKAHEYLFLLSKRPRYYYDADAIKEPAIVGRTPSGVGFGHGFDAKPKPRVTAVPAGLDASVGEGSHGNFHKNGSARGSKRNSFARATKYSAGAHGQTSQHRLDRPDIDYSQTRNKRSVWSIATRPFGEAHFATFPPDLVEPCILAGSPARGVVLDPFGGAGTTGLVADRLGRDAVLIELNPEYADIARRRIAGDAPLFGDVQCA